MHCKECGTLMRWASAVRISDWQSLVVHIHECASCGAVRLDDVKAVPSLQPELETVLATRPMRGSGFVYRAMPLTPKP
jgi:hypothetical protein